MLTEKGTITWSRSTEGIGGPESTIDLAFASSEVVVHVINHVVVDVLGFESDHRVLETTLDLPSCRHSTLRYQWHKMDSSRLTLYREVLKHNLFLLGSPALDSPAAIESYLSKFLAAVELATTEAVPLRIVKPLKRPAYSPKLRRMMDMEAEVKHNYVSTGKTQALVQWQNCRRSVDNHKRTESRQRYRSTIAQRLHGSSGVHQWGRLGKR